MQSSKPCILFRKSIREETEYYAAAKYFNVIEQRSKVPPNSLVIGRYSVLPFYKELEEDLSLNQSTLINSYRQHRYIADLSNWYLELFDLTPKTWFNLSEIPDDGTKFVLKGETNSKKFQWNTHMFAENKQAAGTVMGRLLEDSLIGQQKIYIREYVPLRTFEIDLGGKGLPITEEYRFFVLDGKVVGSSFYWSSHYELLTKKENLIDPKNVPVAFLQDVIERIGKNARFYVIDVARTANNKWIVIELNDGQQSGISEIDPDILYQNMKKVLD